MKFRLSTLAALISATAAGFVLFHTSQNVQQAETRLGETRDALAKEQNAVRVLETEWDYLNRPDRIEDLARQYLKMAPANPAALVRDDGTIFAPPRKAEMLPQNAVVKVRPPAPRKETPLPAPAAKGAGRSFDDLMNSLTKDGPGGGAKP